MDRNDLFNDGYLALLNAVPYCDEWINSKNSFNKDSFKDVIYSAPATIVL